MPGVWVEESFEQTSRMETWEIDPQRHDSLDDTREPLGQKYRVGVW